ncbi:hypothetical protein ALQ51_01727 [Pseudomonas cannabina]|uniref:Uncharacterized protein n=1 Tax=Pseudomonas cannabina TaxID=86840 RepID=A0A3M3SA93_PSECA|nr:hypothetical protein ALQ51_01727 [Pseudomonas cannabina]
MTEKSKEQMARDTLNALIAGGKIPKNLFYQEKGQLLLDQDLLRGIEAQLVSYYSTGPYEPPAPYTLENVF